MADKNEVWEAGIEKTLTMLSQAHFGINNIFIGFKPDYHQDHYKLIIPNKCFKSMAKIITILLFTLFGFMPGQTESYACGKSHANSDKNYAENKSVVSEIKDCCNTENNKKDTKGCDRKCDGSTCFCPPHISNFTIPLFPQFFNIKSIESKRNYYYQDINYSLGFLTI